MIALKPAHVHEFIINALVCKRIPYISGPPGIGKSDIVFQVAKEINLLPLDIRLSQKLPEDLSGLPTVDPVTGKAKYLPFDTFPMEGDPVPPGYDGWMIFLDELSSASDEVWAAIYSLLLGHSVGGMKVHPRAVIVAAGNRESDSAIARRLPDTLITRLLPCEMKVNSQDWITWARSLPSNESNVSVIEYIHRYSDMLHTNVDAKNREELEVHPTPRGWGTCFKIMNLHERISAQNQITVKDSAGIPSGKLSKQAPIGPAIMALLNAAVGTLAAGSFKDHYNAALLLPNPWEVAQSPSSTPIPTTSAGCIELIDNLVSYFVKSAETSRDSVLTYINRMEAEHRSVFVHKLSATLGSTPSDMTLVESVKKRLMPEESLANAPIHPGS